jgi:transcriptional regulator with XRE-family HTH domain
MAGVASSTIVRIEKGEIDPSLGTLERILQAAGFRLQNPEQVSDPAAIAAARGVLEDDSKLLGYPGAKTWVARWTAAGFITEEGDTSNSAALAFRAGMAARLADRPGIRSYARVGAWLDIAERIRQTGCRWAATGGTAANRIVCSADAYWPVFYVDAPEAVAARAGFKPSPGGGQPVLSLVPFDGVADIGTKETPDGFRWAAPLQVLIDCYGGTGRVPEQADALAQFFEGQVHAR